MAKKIKNSTDVLNSNSTINQNIDAWINISCILNTMFLVVAVLCNLLCICVFSKKKLRKTSFNTYLLAIAIFELGFCSIILIDNLTRLVHKEKLHLHQLSELTNTIFQFLVNTIDSILLAIKFIASVDRFHAIKNPIEKKNFITQVHSKRLIASTILILTLLGIINSS